ncbi:MAG: Na+:solute symporter [Candidatus Krumholzibacteria bacterium]|nr:Na+:solute symporter [Candidatus Krumholzibacteria bacterium]
MARVHLTLLDIFIIVLYLVVSFLVGVILSKRARSSTEEYFVSGRSLPWWLIGTSMVATTFAADTPLVVSGLVAKGGIWQNWLWWQWGIGGIVTVFLFSHLWHRARITTDAEFVEFRYDGKPAAILRCYRAIWFGVLQNVLIIAWVMRAMVKIIVVTMGWDSTQMILGMDAESFTVLVLFVITGVYTTISGLWGVVITDFFQFVLAMGGCILTAALAFRSIGGWGPIRDRIAANGFSLDDTFRIIPKAASITAANPFTEFLILVLVVWWATYTVDGGGYLAQRLFAAKNERHSVFGYLWFSVAHMALRPWPWIVVGLCGMAFFGRIDDPERLYPMVMREVLRPGLFGLVLASFFAAFMSTESSQLNWGSSLVVNDFLRRFVWKGKSEKQYLAAAQASVIALAVMGAIASFAIKDISFAWKLIISVTAGVGSVYVARWYWWRVNAWSEIAAMLMALITTFVIGYFAETERFRAGAWVRFPYSTALTVLVTTPVWILVTLVTRPVSREHLVRFYERCHPGGIGWRAVSRDLPAFPADVSGRLTALRIVCGVAALYLVLFGIGHLVLGRLGSSAVILACAAAAGLALFASMRRK